MKEVNNQNINKRTPNAALKRLIYARAKGKCELCESKNTTEHDHIIAWALGGKTTYENMRLLCRNCNQREAFKIFGSHSQLREPHGNYRA